jgi:hypothetical protein
MGVDPDRPGNNIGYSWIDGDRRPSCGIQLWQPEKNAPPAPAEAVRKLRHDRLECSFSNERFTCDFR